jgi:hypothetical protein
MPTFQIPGSIQPQLYLLTKAKGRELNKTRFLPALVGFLLLAGCAWMTTRRAAYATRRVSINGTFVQSWDKGFNEADEQVWGATKGAACSLEKNKVGE